MRLTNLIKHFLIITSIVYSNISNADESKIPEPFRGENNLSSVTIDYHSLNYLLNKTVIDMGRSARKKVKKTSLNIGTRLKNSRKRLTTLEGNRFYFEAFKSEKNRKVLHNIRTELEQLPAKAPLYHFSKKEQLAYWLNLYNVTILDEIVAVYPKRNLASLFEGENALVNQKILNVANIALSLNDIKNVILKEKYNHDPDILYGLYQGFIGAPNIRKKAYTGANVYNALKDNAEEFINSNRGTYSKNKNTFYISNLYERNADYFPNFKIDVTAHILKHLEGYHRSRLEMASTVKANISNWRITDLYGTVRRYGGGNNTNSAALLNAVVGSNTASNSAMSASLTNAVGSLQSGLLTPEQNEILSQLHFVHLRNAGSVTVTDLDESKNIK
ncbi:MAG: DUF547 domain-containing protein [Colwellia sp.]|nr:DUF547 domain-containing protein [Colwellia sp.]